MRRFLPFYIVLTFLFGASFASAEFNSEHWKYNKNIVPRDSMTTEVFVSIDFDTELYNEARVDFGDLRIINSEGGETPYGLISDALEQPRKYEVKITEREDGPTGTETVMVFDLQGDGIPTDTLLLMTTELDISRDIILEGSDNQKNWNVLLGRQNQTVSGGDPSVGSTLSLHYPDSSYRYFRVTVFHGIEKPILFHGASALGPLRRLAFEYDPAFTYILHYGNPAARLPDYVGRTSFEGVGLTSLIPARLSQDVFNEAYVPIPQTSEEDGSSSSRSIAGVIFPIIVGIFVAGHILFWRRKQTPAA
ncbi:MAG: hypothetical protein A3H06_02090 [Candidatus Colwellbacteria bacterium RIFCSPLOWO2_12_FULL_44_13]|uniref:Glucodextranase-like C-terminal domain-containing protein n=3 Tax=Candidatus Colwelliibacteriota TaxID=1817904 RepID=A0A1G1ZB21_9BACT|nr:MAG: hypothetical protein A3F24_01520 [Candidatus Colwellbacteria bacterium RIFCSPHIGHO2_12_FULL_44_17]OGY60817.1 MAG: hypothetical protein A3I31_02455 [Candidatus Colwellbacteria bacterium RIFCSPLOWO2_02_FULL_44_20b]OGY62013.1 MAG: hypothetical protein A3H06_02090 [Candidatus Colwellbacteria bacterium RIFCSPLOWO2_12_FULL_44_13]